MYGIFFSCHVLGKVSSLQEDAHQLTLLAVSVRYWKLTLSMTTFQSPVNRWPLQIILVLIMLL